MRQVPHLAGRPAHHLLIGSGKLAMHFATYFGLLGLKFEIWKDPRTFSPERAAAFRGTHVWFLVSDSAIAEVAHRFRVERAVEDETVLLHASGATVVPGVLGAHPLMTFGPESYTLEAYQKIPFIVEDVFDGTDPRDCLGGLPNVALRLAPNDRPLYHALVSMAGNFPALIWTEIFSQFETRLGLPHETLAPYLFQSLANVLRSGDRALTGPLVRGDRPTVRAHRTALAGTPLGDLYSSFETYFERVHLQPLVTEFETNRDTDVLP